MDNKYLVKETVEVDVETVSNGRVNEYVLSMAISQAKYVANHTHDGSRSTVCQARIVPADNNIMYINPRLQHVV